MGCTGTKKTQPAVDRGLRRAETLFPIAEYPRVVNVLLTMERGQRELCPFRLTEPKLSEMQMVEILEDRMLVSSKNHTACVLPGTDPYGEDKDCQDFAFIESFEGVFFAAVFDGHGLWGHKIAGFCSQFSQDFLHSNIQKAKLDPGLFLQMLADECHRAVTTPESGVDCRLSGTTAVFLLMYEREMHFSCLGDSRIVLATTNPPVPALALEPIRGSDKAFINAIKARRPIPKATIDLLATQLTRDQKPEDPMESARIKAAGGEILRKTDKSGVEIGPFRVWKVPQAYPGIAMARSLGDLIAHSVGVINLPEINHKTRLISADKFLILASDGVWDVMENQEVCDFVEIHRHKFRGAEQKSEETVTSETVPIAQLVCEEARTRWLSIVESESLPIDDISCIVLELIPSGKLQTETMKFDGIPRLNLRENELIQGKVKWTRGDGKKRPETPDTEMLSIRSQQV